MRITYDVWESSEDGPQYKGQEVREVATQPLAGNVYCCSSSIPHQHTCDYSSTGQCRVCGFHRP